eukprot:CAMPEP_0175086324 /NCGR_PEP_ID=MMETSP0052_2-20121109/29183_1 /TAXON_ID=51329 ORGANISM="Polytomella parva, Strain SAG 63-3" /NCGR_SAMPLE_ID=MMETSP0052_2 /ASSEMBLY_ACC=CAM_ASM_000194 /LENGTH=36 /DNA_ID= /DNA_START= /DNA_END= /DNA_ORIENTATION=
MTHSDFPPRPCNTQKTLDPDSSGHPPHPPPPESPPD